MNDDCVMCGEPSMDHSMAEAERCAERAADPLLTTVEDECPTCGAYVLNHDLHRDWHADIARRADAYVYPPMYR